MTVCTASRDSGLRAAVEAVLADYEQIHRIVQRSSVGSSDSWWDRLRGALDATPELCPMADRLVAEAHDLQADYERRGERLWRLAALAGWAPGNPADNDATAEQHVTDALGQVIAQLAALDELATPKVTPSEDMRAAFALAARGIRAALSGEGQP